MYRCLNQVTLVGFVGSDPLVELQKGNPGKKSHAYIRLGMRNKQNWQNVNLVAFDEIAERVAQCQVKKGDHLVVSAYLANSQVTDKTTGKIKYALSVVINNFGKLNKSEQDDLDDSTQ